MGYEPTFVESTQTPKPNRTHLQRRVLCAAERGTCVACSTARVVLIVYNVCCVQRVPIRSGDWTRAARLVKQGLPIGAQMLAEFGAFAAMGLIAGKGQLPRSRRWVRSKKH